MVFRARLAARQQTFDKVANTRVAKANNVSVIRLESLVLEPFGCLWSPGEIQGSQDVTKLATLRGSKKQERVTRATRGRDKVGVSSLMGSEAFRARF
jgi:hypothetical protein